MNKRERESESSFVAVINSSNYNNFVLVKEKSTVFVGCSISSKLMQQINETNGILLTSVMGFTLLFVGDFVYFSVGHVYDYNVYVI